MDIYEMLFNSIAVLIKNVIDNTDEDFFNRYSALGRGAREKINNMLETKFPELFENRQPKEILSAFLYDDALFRRLYSLVQEKPGEYDLQLIVSLLSKLDICLSKRVEHYSTDKEIQGLNTNISESRIQLLPRCACSWEHNSRGANYCSDLSNYLKFFYYIELDRLDGYDVRHIFLDSNIFSKATERRYLQVGLSPLTDQGELEWDADEREGVRYFYVTGVKNQDKLEQNMLSIMDKARTEEVDILCFPEMLGSWNLYNSAVNVLSSFPDGDDFYPPIVVLPSIWENQHNTSIVLDDCGNDIIHQEKQHPYLFPDESSHEKYLEDLKPDKVIHLIHCKGIGRMAVMICKDALMKSYLSIFLNILKVTLLLIPSFSTGHYAFQEIVESCKSADCCACWINTCSVGRLAKVDTENMDTIGMVLKSGKRSLMRNGIYPCERKSQGCDAEGCGAPNCHDCLFIQKIQF